MRARRTRLLDRTADCPELLGLLVESTAQALWQRRSGARQRRWLVDRPPAARKSPLDSFAWWCVNRYPQEAYRALVVGDGHAASAHLAAALDVPWLPILGDGRVSDAYAAVIEQALLREAPVLIVAAKTAPTDRVLLDVAAIAAHARRMGHRPVVVRAPGQVLSAAVAQAYRAWLQAAGRPGDRLIVECGPLLDAWHVLRAGLVPYWCPTIRRRHADALCWWLAGEPPYTSVDVLIQPSGGPSLPGELEVWQSAAAFARWRGEIEGRCLRAYPRRPLTTRQVRKIFQGYGSAQSVPPPLEVADALAAWAHHQTVFTS
jgi:hypothetical protein